MSNKSSLRFFAALLSAAFALAALVLADVGALAQNTNSSTPEESMQSGTPSMSGPRRGRRNRRNRRARRRAARAADAGATDATTTDTTGTATDTGTGSQAGGTTADLGGEQTDLSGTYTGQVTMTGGHEMSGQGTLTITGGNFTLAVDTMNHSGRVTAVTTRGYTGASFFFSDVTDATTNTPVVATVRARKSGDRLTLSPVPGARTRLTFGSGGGSRRGRRSATTTVDMTTTTDSPATGTDATTGAEATGTDATGTTNRSRRGRRGRRGGGATNTNMGGNSNANMGGNSNTGDNSNSNTTPPM